MGRDAEAARIRLAVSDPLPARQRQQTAMGKTMFQNRFTKNFFSFLPFLQGRPGGEHCFTQNSTDLTILAHMVWIEKQI